MVALPDSSFAAILGISKEVGFDRLDRHTGCRLTVRMEFFDDECFRKTLKKTAARDVSNV